MMKIRLWLAGKLIGPSLCVARPGMLGEIFMAARSMEDLSNTSGYLTHKNKAGKKVRRAAQSIQTLVAQTQVRTSGWGSKVK